SLVIQDQRPLTHHEYLHAVQRDRFVSAPERSSGGRNSEVAHRRPLSTTPWIPIGTGWNEHACSDAYRRGLRALRGEQRPHSGDHFESEAFDAVLLVGVGHAAGSGDEVEPARTEYGHRVRDAACDGC